MSNAGNEGENKDQQGKRDAVVGKQVEGSEWLVVNGVVVNYMKGACSVCGSEFFWSISERQLANLIKGVLDKRRK